MSKEPKRRKPTRRPNEKRRVMFSTSVVNPFLDNCSSPRAVMDSGHMSSHLPILYPDVREGSFEGIEWPFGSIIDDVRAEYDCVIKSIIPKLQDKDINPELAVIVEFEDAKGELCLDLIRVPVYKSKHTKFGYRLHLTEALKDVGMNEKVLTKGTVLARTDSYDEEDGFYKFGKNANIVNISHLGVAEDGIYVSDRFCESMKFTVVDQPVINLTKNTIPVNKYGDLNYFKFMPDIGEVVEDGELCVYRTRNDNMSIADLNDKDICRVDAMFDIPTKVEPGSVVVDIRVIKGRKPRNQVYSDNMTVQLEKYANIELKYAENIYDAYCRIRAEARRIHGKNYEPKRTGELQRVITDKLILVESSKCSNKLSKRSLEIDQYRVEITTMAVKTPTKGNKISDLSANLNKVLLTSNCY